MITFIKFVIVGLTIRFTNVVSTSNPSEDFTSHISAPSFDIRNSSAAEKWLAADRLLRGLTSMTVRTLLPQAIRDSDNVNIASGCSIGLLKLMTGIRQTKLWAFRMLDSFGKIPNGILSGSISALGDYDLCIETEIPGNSRGRYCVVDVTPPLPDREPFVAYDKMIPEFVDITPPDSVTTQVLKFARNFYRLRLRTSVCVPSTCSKDDVQMLASKAMELTGLQFDVIVSNCEVKVDKLIFGTSEIVIMIVLLTLAVLAIAATTVDVIMRLRSKDEGKLCLPVRCLLCFSLYTNSLRLLKKDESSDSIKIFHGIKVITVLWMILSHTYLYTNMQAMSGILQARAITKEMAFQVVTNGFLAYETFFFISAVLSAYGVMKMQQKSLNIFLFILRRIWRMAPPFMFVIACIYLIPHLGSGPVWKETVVDELTEKCKEKWWTNLLFLNNFVSYSDMCMKWSWYIPVETQLYIISIIVLIPLKSNPRQGLIVDGALFFIGIITSAVMHIYYTLPPKILPLYDYPDDIAFVMDNGYHRTYVHCSTYCVGLAVGYFLTKKQKILIPLGLNIFGWIAAFTVGISVIYGVYDWNQGNMPISMISTLYGSTVNTAWAMALAWVTIACMAGHGGIATSILSWDAFVPLGRLTYMTYLVHPIIIFMYVGSTITLIHNDHRTLALATKFLTGVLATAVTDYMVFQYLGTVLMAYICAFPLNLLFESPFTAMEELFSSKIRLSGGDKDKISVNKISEPNHNSKNFVHGEENAAYVTSMTQINYVE